MESRKVRKVVMHSQRMLYFVFTLGMIAIIAIAVLGVRDAMERKRGEVRDSEKKEAGLGLTPEARAQFEERKRKALASIKEKPDLVIPYVELSNVEKALGNLDAAIDALVRAGQIAPKNHLVWSNLGVLYMEKRMHKEAEIVFERAVHYGPKEVQNYLQYAEFLQYRAPERKDDILALYEKGLAALQGNVTLLKARAAYYSEIGEKAKALLDWKEVLRKTPDDAAVREEIRVLEENS